MHQKAPRCLRTFNCDLDLNQKLRGDVFPGGASDFINDAIREKFFLIKTKSEKAVVKAAVETFKAEQVSSAVAQAGIAQKTQASVRELAFEREHAFLTQKQVIPNA